jgi:hypothetical protein
MQGAEDRQGRGETQIAQGDDIVQAVGLRDIGLCSPKRNKEEEDTGAAHRNHRARDLKKCGENGYVHVDGKIRLASSSWGTFSRSTQRQTVQRRVGEHIFLRSSTDARPEARPELPSRPTIYPQDLYHRCADRLDQYLK